MPAFALRLTGIETDDNPYMLRALAHFAAFVDETIMKVISDEAESAPKIYYVTANPYANLRSCAATNCKIVGAAQHGDAVTVIDDSGEWYEVQLENGDSAFVAGFLTSEKPPGRLVACVFILEISYSDALISAREKIAPSGVDCFWGCSQIRFSSFPRARTISKPIRAVIDSVVIRQFAPDRLASLRASSKLQH